jgi:hypothetical protein
MERLKASIAIAVSISAIFGGIFGQISLQEMLFPSDPPPVGMVDGKAQMLDEGSPPNLIHYRFYHNGTDTFRVLEFQAKFSSFRDIDCVVPSSDPEIFARQNALLNPERVGMFDLLIVEAVNPSELNQEVHIVTQDGKDKINPFVYENGDVITFDYVFVDENGQVLDIGKEYWTGVNMTWENLDEPGVQHTTWSRANTLENSEFCK